MAPLGVGLVFMPSLLPLLRQAREAVSVVELEPQMLWQLRRGKAEQSYVLNRERFDEILALTQRIIIHSVGLPVGGTQAPDAAQASLVASMAEAAQSPWVSDHLSFNTFGDDGGSRCAGFFLPPRQCPTAVAVAAANVRRLRKLVRRPVAVETGVNYLRPNPNELPDGLFFQAVADEADCGLVVDLHNLWTNERNGRQRAREALAQLPPDRVWEVHVAGGTAYDGYWLDAHCDVIPGPVLDLAAEWIPRWPRLGALVFEILDEHVEGVGLAAIEKQMDKLNDLWKTHAGAQEASGSRLHFARNASAHPASARALSDLAAYERALGLSVLGDERVASDPSWTLQDRGVRILRDLVRDARTGFIAQGLRFTMTLLMLELDDSRRQALIHEYLRVYPAELYVAAECDGFARYLSALALEIPYLDEVLAFEHALVRATLHEEDGEVAFLHDPVALLDSLANGRLPLSITDSTATLRVRPGVPSLSAHDRRATASN